MQPKKELLVYYQKSLDELDGYEIESGEDYDEESLRDASQDTDEEELEEEEDLYLTDLLGGLTNGTKRTIH
jgi:mannose/fructose-specific phosphotransferase system component IIA